MKKYFLFSLIAFALSLNTKAQSDFQDGYIIKDDNKIIYGQIKFTGNDFTPSYCVFKWFDISESVTYSPKELKSFGFVNGGRFESVRFKNKSIFIACFVTGKVNLLYNGKSLFVQNNDIGLAPLSYKSTYVTFSGEKTEVRNYKELLEKLLTGSTSFSIPPGLQLESDEMTRLISEYNLGSQTETKVFVANNKEVFFSEMKNTGAYRLKYGVTGGISATRFKTTPINRSATFIPEMTFYEYTPMAGLFINRQLSRLSEVALIQAEVLLYKNKIYLYQEEKDLTNIYRSDIYIDYIGIKIPIFLQFNLSKGKITPNLNVGITRTFYLGGSYSRSGEKEDTNHVVRPFEDNSLSLSKGELGLMAGAGVKYRLNPKTHLFINARAEYDNGIFQTDTFDQKTITIMVLGGFNF